VGRPTRIRSRLVKGNRFIGPGRLPSTSALHPTALLAHRRTRLRRSSSSLALGGAPRSRVERGCRGDYRLHGRNPACDEPASLLACSWLFATAIRLPAPLHPPSLSSPHGVERRWARPSRALVRGGRGPNAARRLLQYKQSASTTCESTDPHVTEHPELTLARSARLTCFRPRGPEPPPDPRLAPGTRLPLRGAPKAPPGSRPPSRGHGLRRELGRGWLLLRSPFQHHPGSCDPERSHWRVRSLRQPRSHGPGANGFRHKHLPQRAAQRHARAGASPQPDPLGHLLSWHRRLEPEGDSDLPCDPTEGRITRPSAKKAEIRRTRGAFHR